MVGVQNTQTKQIQPTNFIDWELIYIIKVRLCVFLAVTHWEKNKKTLNHDSGAFTHLSCSTSDNNETIGLAKKT